MRKMNAETVGIANAYKTLYVTGGVDAKTLGTNLADLDLKGVHGSLETRIAAAAGTPPILVGLSEGLNAGQYNIYGQAKRAYVDGTIRPDWGDLFACLQTLITPPNGSRLWYDDRDVPYLREDQKDQAEIVSAKATAIQNLLTAGFEPDAVIEAVETGDMRGHHTGLFSVQLLPPNSAGTMDDPAPTEPATPPAMNGASKAMPAMAGTGGPK